MRDVADLDTLALKYLGQHIHFEDIAGKGAKADFQPGALEQAAPYV